MSTREPADDDLLAAYLDGVSELTPDERRRVEARLAEDPALRDDAETTRALLGQLRELPPEGKEPDWRAMAQAISAEVGEAAPRVWWKRWTWLAPITALALAGAVLAFVLRTPEPTPVAPAIPDAGIAQVSPPAPSPSPSPSGEPETVPLWLDGTQVDVDVDVADANLLPEGELSADEVEGAPADLMASDDLAWVDELGEDDIAAAEAWLARKKS